MLRKKSKTDDTSSLKVWPITSDSSTDSSLVSESGTYDTITTCVSGSIINISDWNDLVYANGNYTIPPETERVKYFDLKDKTPITLVEKEYWMFMGYHGHPPEDCKDIEEYKKKLILLKL